MESRGREKRLDRLMRDRRRAHVPFEKQEHGDPDGEMFVCGSGAPISLSHGGLAAMANSCRFIDVENVMCGCGRIPRWRNKQTI